MPVSVQYETSMQFYKSHFLSVSISASVSGKVNIPYFEKRLLRPANEVPGGGVMFSQTSVCLRCGESPCDITQDALDLTGTYPC